MASFVLLMVFIGILAFAFSMAIAIYIATERGLGIKKGIIFGFIPFIGQIALTFIPVDDKRVVEEMYQRNLIDYGEYEKTMEVVVQRTQEVKMNNKK